MIKFSKKKKCTNKSSEVKLTTRTSMKSRPSKIWENDTHLQILFFFIATICSENIFLFDSLDKHGYDDKLIFFAQTYIFCR